MFNPLYPFTPEVLQQTVKRGCSYFVRNTWPPAADHFEDGIKGYFLISHYDDLSQANAHFNSISNDPHRFLYEWNDPAHRERLEKAAHKPAGYRIYSTYFYPDYKKKITKNIREKINRYMYRNTDWKPGSGETVHIDLYLQFGLLYLTMKYAGQELKIKFADIET
ncbi:MAG: hypothetical protein WKF35_08200 [Ferruginibacter sp.]